MSQSLFNSLGSNYSTAFVSQAAKLLLGTSASKNESSIEALLFDSLHKSKTDAVTLTYKGRHALSLGLSQNLKPGSKVGLQAFTCWAVEEAIQAAGMEPVFIDIAPDSLNLDLETIKASYTQHKDLKAIIIQHTLGFTAPLVEIMSWAQENQILIIEDLAHAFGAETTTGEQAGSLGDLTALSFGRDKILDAVSGGALISPKNTVIKLDDVSGNQVRRDLLYPLITWLIRSTYSTGLGKYIHYLSKRLGLMTSPIANSSPNPKALPLAHQELLRTSLSEFDETLAYRKTIAKIYQTGINPSFQIGELDVVHSANLRYPIRLTQKEKLLKQFAQNKFYLSDTWFKEPVEKGSLKVNSAYVKNSCANAEKLSKEIVNLPTHRHVTPALAHKLVTMVNTCQ